LPETQEQGTVDDLEACPLQESQVDPSEQLPHFYRHAKFYIIIIIIIILLLLLLYIDL
jgi:hypothetical protein